jgi:flavin-dependent dehydrogenase
MQYFGRATFIQPAVARPRGIDNGRGLPTMQTETETNWDVIIIGGGPAGSTAATTLAQAGRRVLVLEKMKFPRFHIGESLLPYNRKIFDDLGVWEKLSTVGFTKKRAAQFILGNDTRGSRLDFSKGAFTEFPEAMQVERAKFDDILLHHSRENGAEVREESQVLEHRVEPDRVILKYRAADGTEQEVAAPYLIDASGLGNFTANRESQREYYSGHKKIAIFSHFDGVEMPTGEEEGDILIVRREKSWMWMIPLAADKVSVGLVIDAANFKTLGITPQEAFDNAVLTTPAVGKRFVKAEMLEKLHVIADFSYKNERLVSPRVLRAGDASGFIDPMFSSGVLLAMTSGQQGAQAIHQALETRHPLTAGMKRYEKDNRKRIAIYWEFIENFYKLHFAQIFFQPYNRWGMVCSINAVLAGCTSLSFAVWWRLRAFFFLAWLNQHVPVAKRIKID